MLGAAILKATKNRNDSYVALFFLWNSTTVFNPHSRQNKLSVGWPSMNYWNHTYRYVYIHTVRVTYTIDTLVWSLFMKILVIKPRKSLYLIVNWICLEKLFIFKQANVATKLAQSSGRSSQVRNILFFFSSRSLKMREKIYLVCLSLYTFVFTFQFLIDEIHNYIKK